MNYISTIIQVNKNTAEDLVAKSDLAAFDIKVSLGEAPTINGARLFDPEVIWVRFEIPADRVSDIANIEGDVPVIMSHLQQAAKKYLAEKPLIVPVGYAAKKYLAENGN